MVKWSFPACTGISIGICPGDLWRISKSGRISKQQELLIFAEQLFSRHNYFPWQAYSKPTIHLIIFTVFYGFVLKLPLFSSSRCSAAWNARHILYDSFLKHCCNGLPQRILKPRYLYSVIAFLFLYIQVVSIIGPIERPLMRKNNHLTGMCLPADDIVVCRLFQPVPSLIIGHCSSGYCLNSLPSQPTIIRNHPCSNFRYHHWIC